MGPHVCPCQFFPNFFSIFSRSCHYLPPPLFHSKLHWLDVPQRIQIQFKLTVTVQHVCRAMRLSTLSTTASLRPRLPVASSSALQVNISSSCHITVTPISAVGHLLLQERWPGTHCKTIYVIHGLMKTLSVPVSALGAFA